MIKKYFFILIAIVLTGCVQKHQLKDPIPIYDSFSINSTSLSETRTINVWTPPSYQGSRLVLPVLFMLDGGIKEDFPHIANTIAKLIKENSIPPIILVGIENTDRRRDLTGISTVIGDKKYAPLSDGAKNFRAFISKELFTEIEKRYRITGKKGIVGESLAGLFVVETLFLKPNMFDYYIAMDPSLWWNNHSLVDNSKEYLTQFSSRKTRFWFAGSSAKDISLHTIELANILKHNTIKTLEWTYSDEPNEKHHTIFRATKEKAFIWALNTTEEK